MTGPLNPHEVTQIGRYTDVVFHAEGGMSWVFRVKDPDLFDAPRALKLLKPHAAAGEEFGRFEAEAKLLAQIQHPNLVRVSDFGRDPGTGLYFYTMDWIEGGSTLADIRAGWLEGADATILARDPNATHVGDVELDEKAVTLEGVCNYFVDVLSALARLHRQGIVHRDVKPQNIFVTPGGGATLGDLGIAKAHGSAGVTREGVTPGTPLYMSPEHSLGEEVSVRSDLFSVGLTMYRVLTGRTVYDAAEGVDSTNSQAVLRHLWELHGGRGEFTFHFPPQIPEPLCEVVRDACRMEAGDRYPSATEMSEALRDAIVRLREAPAARPIRVPVLGRRALARILVGVAAVALIGVGFMGYRTWLGHRAEVRKMGDQTAGYQERAGMLVDWLATREKGPPVEILREARGEIRSANDRVEDGRDLIAEGQYSSAQRMFTRAQASLVNTCDRLADRFLVKAAAVREAAALEALGTVPPAGEALVPGPWAKLREQVVLLHRNIAPAGCERAESLRERIEVGSQVIVQAEVVRSALDDAWPGIMRDVRAEAEAALLKAQAAAVPLPAYESAMDAANERGGAARRALERGEYALAYAEAGKALAGFQRVAALKPAWQAQQDARAIVAEAESQELSIGVQRTKHLAGEGAFDAGGWDEARRIFREVHKEVERLIVAARPAIAAREVAVEERRRAIQVGVEASALKRADSRLDEGLGRLRASRFKSSEEAFSDAAALYTAAIDKQERALAKLERESEIGREADQRQAAAEKARLAAEEAKIREELTRLEAKREKAHAEAEREQARLEELRNKAGAQTEQEKVRKELARLEAEREKAHAEAEREQARLEQLRKKAREEAEREKARQSQTKKQREERVQVAKVETTRAAPRAKGPTDAIRSVMSEYEAAFKARNVEQLNTVWAMSPFERKSLEIEMRKCSEIKIEIKIIGDPAIRGQKALVDFEEFSHWRQCRDRRRAPSWLKLRAELLLRAGSEWQIKRIWQPKD